jgi:hypothetical protein
MAVATWSVQITKQLEVVEKEVDDPVQSLESLGDCIAELKSYTTATHLHLAGEWNAFCAYRFRHLGDIASLKQNFSCRAFEDRFYDNFSKKLGQSGIWLRRRIFLNGQLQWTMKWRVAKEGNTLTYKEVQGVDDILQVLRNEFQTHLDDEESLLIAFPVRIASFSCVRVSCSKWKKGDDELYFEVVKIADGCYYSLVTVELATHAVGTTEIDIDSNANVLSKVMAYLYHNNRDYFLKLLPNGDKDIDVAFTTTTPPLFVKLFDTLAKCDAVQLIPMYYD